MSFTSSIWTTARRSITARNGDHRIAPAASLIMPNKCPNLPGHDRDGHFPRPEAITASAGRPAVTQKKRPATPPADVVNVIDQVRATGPRDVALFLWLVAITGVRRGELCAVQLADIDLGSGVVHIVFNYLVKAGHKLRKDTKTCQERHLAIDPVTCALVQETLDETATALAAVGLNLAPSAFLFSNDPARLRPWNPDWVTHRVSDLAQAAGADLARCEALFASALRRSGGAARGHRPDARRSDCSRARDQGHRGHGRPWPAAAAGGPRRRTACRVGADTDLKWTGPAIG